jgi:hypothetical protein
MLDPQRFTKSFWKWFWIWIAVGVVLVIFIQWKEPSIGYLTSCKGDDEIPAATREDLARFGLSFVHSILSDIPDAAYPMLTDEARQAVSQDQFLQLRQKLWALGPFEKLRVTKTYLLRSAGTGQNSLAPCAAGGNKVFVAVKPEVEQSYLMIDGRTENGGWAFVLWLMKDAPWRVQSFHADRTSIVWKTAGDLLNLARSEESAQHHFNAVVLYSTARDLSSHGPNFQLQAVQDISNEMAKVPVPRELQGQAPFAWRFDGRDFHILKVGPIGLAGEIYLSITHEVALSDKQETERINGDLLSGFAEAFPEYRSVFAGLIAEARERGGDAVFRTTRKAQVSLK